MQKILNIKNKLKKLNRKNLSLLHYAGKKNSKEIGEKLISLGKDVNDRDKNY